MKEHIKHRVLKTAKHYIENKSTIRQTALDLGLSKSTVYIDLYKRLPLINKMLYKEVSMLGSNNVEIRHLRGGQTTKEKYKGEKK